MKHYLEGGGGKKQENSNNNRFRIRNRERQEAVGGAAFSMCRYKVIVKPALQVQ